MTDQLQNSEALGFRVGAVNSTVSSELQWTTLSRYLAGAIDIIFTSPEQLFRKPVSAILRDNPPGLVVIDEGHCIATWGPKFRPIYRRLGEFRAAFSNVPTLVMTATAKPEVRKDVCECLGLRRVVTVEVPFSFGRTFLSAKRLETSEERLGHVLALARVTENLPMIVFCLSRKRCDALALALSEIGLAATVYHSGLSPSTRAANGAEFLRSKNLILVATAAFEMGVDKADVRTVVHFDLPSSVESYVQGVGRCGRDKRAAKATLFFSERDLDMIDYMGQHQTSQTLDMSAAIECFRYASTKDCRERYLNQVFFPGAVSPSKRCFNCDNCERINMGLGKKNLASACRLKSDIVIENLGILREKFNQLRLRPELS